MHMESNVTPDHPAPRLGKMALVKIDSLSRKITQLYSITTSLGFVVHSAPLLERRHSLELVAPKAARFRVGLQVTCETLYYSMLA